MSGLESGLAGLGVGLAYAIASYATYRFALTSEARSFMAIVFGGVVVRLFVFTAIVLLVLLTLPIRPGAFVGTFLAMFLVGLVMEVALLLRVQANRQPDRAT